jgi:AcrR family transcriptional regulator
MTESLVREAQHKRRRRPRQGPATRRLILESSLRLFSDRGYARTSVRDIAQAVGITDAAIYYHFSSKRDLLRAVFEERGIAAALHELEALEPMPDPTEQLRKVCLTALHILTRNHDFLKVMLVEALAEDPEAVEEWRAAVDRWVQATARVFRIYEDRGVFRTHVEVAAEELVDSVLGAYLDALIPGRDDVSPSGEPSERLVAQVSLSVQNAVRGLQDGLATA